MQNGSMNGNDVSAWAMLNRVLTAIHNAGVEYAVLGETDDLKEDLDSDVDLVIPNGSFDAFRNILHSVCLQNEARIVQAIQHEQTAWFYILAWRGADGNPQYLQLDVCSHYYRSGQLLIDGRYLLDNRQPQFVSDSNIFVPDTAPRFLYYLVKKCAKGSITDGQVEFLRSLWDSASHEEKTEIANRFSNHRVEDFDQIFRNAELKNSLPGLHNAFSVPRKSLGSRIRETARLVRRVLQPTGLFVVMMGPDGSGKTTINTLVRQRVATAFWMKRYFHFRPFVGTADDETDIVTDPHGVPPRGTVSSLAKLVYYVFDYVVGYMTRVRPVVSRTGLVIFDRYYADIAVDPARYRFGAPHWLLRVFRPLIPQPDLYLFLDVDADVILSRKQEVSREECIRQVDAYRKSAEKLNNAVLLDASQPPGVVANQAAWSILNRLADRIESTAGEGK